MNLLDGTGLSMTDTAENQARFPQPSRQAEGAGFPQLRLCVVLYLAKGALLADALYADYFQVAQLIEARFGVLLLQHGSRHTDFRRGRRLGVRDHVVHWP